MSSAVLVADFPNGVPKSDFLYEIINGERVEIPHMRAFSGAAATLLTTYINQYAAPRHLGMAVIEALFEFSPRWTARRPDVGFIPAESLPHFDELTDDPEELAAVPTLAV